MFNDALYYPYINVTDNLWLRRSILYWDKIKPICPYALEENIHVNHISMELRQFGAIEFIHPEDILGTPEGYSISRQFLEKITDPKFLDSIGKPENIEYVFRIHKDKFSDELLKNLDNYRLYINDQSDRRWLLFESTTGRLYMAFLALILATKLYLEPSS